MIINKNHAFSHRHSYTMKRNGFVGELLPEISGVENHSAKKEKNKVTVPRRKQMRKIDRKEKNIFKILNVQNEEVSSLKPFLLQTYFSCSERFWTQTFKVSNPLPL